MFTRLALQSYLHRHTHTPISAYRVTRTVVSESLISKLHLLFKKILLVTSRHSRSLGFQPCIPIFHIHLCTVGHQNFQDQKFEIGLLATQKQIKSYWMTKPHQNNHKKFWLAGFFNTSKILQNEWKNMLKRVQKIWKSFFAEKMLCLLLVFNQFVVSLFV